MRKNSRVTIDPDRLHAIEVVGSGLVLLTLCLWLLGALS